MKDEIKRRIELIDEQLKMIEFNYKCEMDSCQVRYKELCSDLQQLQTILFMALNSPYDNAEIN